MLKVLIQEPCFTDFSETISKIHFDTGQPTPLYIKSTNLRFEKEAEKYLLKAYILSCFMRPILTLITQALENETWIRQKYMGFYQNII